jgi:membrane-bound metal-dependent hydrolase YbcI (DUF457 family)
MAALGHLSVGLAAKRVAPEVPVGYLILGAYMLDILWFAFYPLGLALHTKHGFDFGIVWTHSLLMATVWSALATVIARRIAHSTRTGVVFGLMVFSHWLVDVITHPMSALTPDEGLPLAFYSSPKIGLGMYSTMFGVYAGEFGTLAVGIVIYIFAKRKSRKESAPAAKA